MGAAAALAGIGTPQKLYCSPRYPLLPPLPRRRWLPSKARDYDLSPYASPRATSPLAPLPLAAVAAQAGGGAGGAISEAPSGSATPGGYTSDNSDGASPRAVLRGASALLLTHQAAQGRGQQQGAAGAAQAPAAQAAQPPAGPSHLVRKSLLTSSLAPSRRGGSPEACSRGASPGLTPGASPAAAAAPAAPMPALHLGAPAVVHHAPSGLSYRVSSEWMQPAIRTVKMQGAQPRKLK